MEQVGPVQSHINGFVVLQLSQNATSMGLRDLLSRQIQHAIVLVLDSLAGDNPEGMSVSESCEWYQRSFPEALQIP